MTRWIGVVLAFAAACGSSDGNNPGGGDDGPSDASSGGSGSGAAHKHVFVTSGTWEGDLYDAAGLPASTDPDRGVAGADKLCQSAAMAGQLGGTWKAIVARIGMLDSLADAGPWYLTDNTTKVFNNLAQVKNTPSAPISFDELGQNQGAGASSCVFTGYQIGGSLSQDCGRWTSHGDGLEVVTVGDLRVSSSAWLTGSGHCNDTCHLYCIQQ